MFLQWRWQLDGKAIKFISLGAEECEVRQLIVIQTSVSQFDGLIEDTLHDLLEEEVHSKSV